MNLITYFAPRATGEPIADSAVGVVIHDSQWRHDKVLCLEHVAILNDLLYPTSQRDKPVILPSRTDLQ